MGGKQNSRNDSAVRSPAHKTEKWDVTSNSLWQVNGKLDVLQIVVSRTDIKVERRQGWSAP